jgi:hypothetical protein
MRTMPLQFLTWGTITAAVGSAAWLSSIDQAPVFCSAGYRATSHAIGLEILGEPARTGASATTRESSPAKPHRPAATAI